MFRNWPSLPGAKRRVKTIAEIRPAAGFQMLLGSDFLAPVACPTGERVSDNRTLDHKTHSKGVAHLSVLLRMSRHYVNALSRAERAVAVRFALAGIGK